MPRKQRVLVSIKANHWYEQRAFVGLHALSRASTSVFEEIRGASYKNCIS